MIKSFLKKILPVVFRKNAFLVYNTVRIKTVDKLLMPELKIPKKEFFLYNREKPFQNYGLRLDDSHDTKVNWLMRNWYEWSDEEYILINREPGFIEPIDGWFVTKKGKLHFYSVGMSRAMHQKKPALKYFFKKDIPATHYKKLISLRDTGEDNYFHFYNDVLTKIFFLIKKGFNVMDYEILISDLLYSKPFFKFFREQHPLLKELRWVIQGSNECISADEIVFCKASTHRMNYLKPIFDPVKEKFASNVEPQKNYFLIRNPKRLRFISNLEDLKPLCEKNNIEIVDADDLNMQQQIQLFSSAKSIIAIHGAGLTNLMFGQEGCKVAEIFPPSFDEYLPFHYSLMAKQLKMLYYPVIGESSQKMDGGFILPIKSFENIVANTVI